MVNDILKFIWISSVFIFGWMLSSLVYAKVPSPWNTAIITAVAMAIVFNSKIELMLWRVRYRYFRNKKDKNEDIRIDNDEFSTENTENEK